MVSARYIIRIVGRRVVFMATIYIRSAGSNFHVFDKVLTPIILNNNILY